MSQGKGKQDKSGIGASEPVRGREVGDAIASLIGMPLSSGYGKCLLSLGVDAAESLLSLARDGQTYRQLVAESESKPEGGN